MKFKDFKHLPVYTKSGDFLGKVFDLEIDENTQEIVSYEVIGSNLIKKLAVKKLIISSKQVVEITPVKMVVEDNLSSLSGRLETAVV